MHWHTCGGSILVSNAIIIQGRKGIQVNDTIIMVTNSTKYLTTIITKPRPQNGTDNDKTFNDDDGQHIFDCPRLVGNNEADHDLIQHIAVRINSVFSTFWGRIELIKGDFTFC